MNSVDTPHVMVVSMEPNLQSSEVQQQVLSLTTPHSPGLNQMENESRETETMTTFLGQVRVFLLRELCKRKKKSINYL